MIDWLNIKIDAVSFWVGVIASSLFWFLFGQIKGVFKRLFIIVKRLIKDFQDQNLKGVETLLRQDALRRAQKAHLSASLFALDEILIPPKLLAPPPLEEPGVKKPADWIIPAALPYQPDYPQLSSQYPGHFLQLNEAVQKGANLVIIGQAGAGKTVALAHFVTLLARQDSECGSLQEFLPLYFHILDLPPINLEKPVSDIDRLIQYLQSRLPTLQQARARDLIKKRLFEGRALLVVDGLDELPVDFYKEAVNWLRGVLADYPRLRVITTSSQYYFDGLIALGFHALTIKPWNHEERVRFINQWGKRWDEKINPIVQKHSPKSSIDPYFITSWLSPDYLHLSPADWTFLLWSVYSGESLGDTPFTPLANHLQRSLIDESMITQSSQLALSMLQNNKPFIDSTLGMISQDLLDLLKRSGLICEISGKRYRFCHLLYLAFLAGLSENEDSFEGWEPRRNYWETRNLSVFIHLSLAQQDLVQDLWLADQTYLRRKELLFGQLLKFLAPSHPSRPRILKRMAEGLLDVVKPSTVRFAYASVLLSSNDASVKTLFRKLLASNQANLRALACLALGALQDSPSINNIVPLLSDQNPDVRRNACIALGIMDEGASLDILKECLESEDEIIRQTAAEALGVGSSSGQEVLKRAASSEELLVRRAAAFGLSRLRETWAKDLLKEMAVQDNQWVVRNAASQALDMMEAEDPNIPYPLMPPSETPWVLAYAGKLGVGIVPGDRAAEILLHALQSGSTEERLASLDLLRTYNEEIVYNAVSFAAEKEESPVKEMAQLTLWYIGNIDSIS